MSGTTLHAQVDVFSGIQPLLERVADHPLASGVELLIIGAVVYTTLRFFQGTRGARLLRAVFSILVVSFAVVWLTAERIEAERIKVLYPYFVLSVFLVSLVAFQTELRRLLLRLGEGAWLRRWIRDSHEAVEPIVIAVERLSRKKVGALIAIERRGEVGPLIESGVRLDAELTAELLETIFWPGTPLHDLGVIVHGGRIQAAGCQFPLAESGEVDRALGSRHRAGIGMSQEAECVVVIVSEQSGAISVAVRGRLRRNLSLAELRTTLNHELGGDEVLAAQASVSAPAADPPGDNAAGPAVPPLSSPGRECSLAPAPEHAAGKR